MVHDDRGAVTEAVNCCYAGVVKCWTAVTLAVQFIAKRPSLARPCLPTVQNQRYCAGTDVGEWCPCWLFGRLYRIFLDVPFGADRTCHPGNASFWTAAALILIHPILLQKQRG
jgi:hypothetical protein